MGFVSYYLILQNRRWRGSSPAPVVVIGMATVAKMAAAAGVAIIAWTAHVSLTTASVATPIAGIVWIASANVLQNAVMIRIVPIVNRA